jgi:hypothetical protein
MEIRKLISKFITSLVENNYAQANDDLKKVVEEKVKARVAKTAKKVEAEADKKNPFAKKGEDKENPFAKKGEKKGKLSKEENKKRFMEMIAKKKGSKKTSKKGK